MHDFVVYIEGKVGTNDLASTNTTQVATTRIAQHGAMFTPHVLPIMVGTTIAELAGIDTQARAEMQVLPGGTVIDELLA